MNWQPIDTAPKHPAADGLPPEIVAGWYNNNHNWVQCTSHWMIWPNGAGNWAGLTYAGKPTHWCPIPEPPPLPEKQPTIPVK